ncbi:hypothetical protein HERIO_160 [Hepatospora eriocheir]|uniref:Uncharacterized protein n=1 Tax=Hepatospora eriocheir TaxID=1081669 RepID=A0A1X0QDY9_9MICR|nr:hypothetical protein HERIO_160 [Hepatospora eriocheir]
MIKIPIVDKTPTNELEEESTPLLNKLTKSVKAIKIVQIIKKDSLLEYNYNDQLELLIQIMFTYWNVIKIIIKDKKITMYCNENQKIFDSLLKFEIDKRNFEFLKYIFEMFKIIENKKEIIPKFKHLKVPMGYKEHPFLIYKNKIILSKKDNYLIFGIYLNINEIFYNKMKEKLEKHSVKCLIEFDRKFIYPCRITNQFKEHVSCYIFTKKPWSEKTFGKLLTSLQDGYHLIDYDDLIENF